MIISNIMDFSSLNNINTFIFDVDGVLTDSTILVTEKGDLLRTMNVRDGQAIKIALNSGYKIGVITKGNSNGVKRRLSILGIKDICDNVKNKMEALEYLKREKDYNLSTTLYMGDDLPDLTVADHIAVFSCPSNAASEVIVRADYISAKGGGLGCVREIIEKVLRIQGKWPI